jgi:hypothetical protein
MAGMNQTLSASGTITATVTGPAAPSSVIVEQDCVVSWSGGTGATGSCNNPLGGSAMTTSPGPGQSWTFSTYTYVSAPSPTYSCAPTATVTVPNGVSGAVSVEYRVVVTAVGINPGGAVQDSSGNWNILIGQKCSPTLSGVPSAPAGTTATYAWTVSGSKFQSWTASSSSTAYSRPPA